MLMDLRRALSDWREGLLWKSYALVALALGTAYFVLSSVSGLQQVIYLLFVGAAPIAILVGVRRYRPDSRRHWLLFAGGLILWCAGDAYWQGYVWFLGKQAPYPSVADYSYLIGYPLVVAGIFVLVRGWGRPRIGNLLDAAIVSLAGGVFSMLFLLKPLLSTTEPAFAKLIAVAFPVMDFVMLVALTQLMFRRRVMSFALRAITVGTVALLLADAAYSRLGLDGTYTSGMMVDAGWLISYALWGIAALHPSMAKTKSLSEQEGVGLSAWRVGALLVAMLVAPVVLIAQHLGESDTTDEIAGVIVATMLLVAARVWLLQRDGKKSQAALTQSDERFRLAQAVSDVGTWDMNLLTGEIALSENLGELIMGSSSVPANFQAWQDFIHPGDRERVTKNFADARDDGSNFEHEYRFRQPDGAEGWMYSRGRVFLDDTGAPVRALGVAVDITGRHTTELQLKRSEEHFRLAEAAAKVGSWDMDLQTDELLWSDSMRALMGVSADIPPTHDVFVEWIHPEDRAWVDRDMAHTLEHGGEFEREYRYRRADGVEGWIESRGRALVDDKGTPVRAVGVLMDTTDRHHAEAHQTRLEHQLRQAHKLEAVGRLAGGVAHDFNNILLAIRGNGELALDSLKQGENPAEEVEEMIAAAERAAALTGQLLAFSRRQVLQAEVLDLNEVVEDMDKLLRRMIGEDVELDAVLSDEPVYVSADRSQVEQVIANLAVNARDAMPAGGLLTLEVTTADIASKEQIDLAPGRYAQLTVSDTGSGMDPETVAKIFEPFFTTKEEGTGFGLSTVHGIVVQSGGSIWVYSEIDHGTTFKVFLPLAEQALALETTLPKIVPSLPKSVDETILLVEDDPHVQRIVRNILTRSGYRVLAAGHAEDAVLLAEEHDGTIHLLLSDLVMPGTSGRKLAEQIQALRPQIGILYMSGYTDDAVIRRGVLEAGMAFIQKPFGAEDLGRRVREVLDGQSDRTPVAA